MARTIAVLLLTLLCCTLPLHAEPASGRLYPVLKGGKFGYIDARGKLVVPPTLDGVWGETCDGRGLARKGKQWGFIDHHGKWIVPPRYSDGVVYNQGRAWLKDAGGWHLFDVQGREIAVKPVPTSVGRFSEGVCEAASGGKVGYIDRSGKWVIKPTLPVSPGIARPFKEGLARLVKVDGPAHKFGFIDRKGKTVVPMIYDAATDFSEGVAGVVLIVNTQPKTLKFLYIDKHNKIRLTRPNYCYQFQSGRAVAFDSKTKKHGYIDKRGQFVIAPSYDAANEFSEGRGVVAIGRRAQRYPRKHGPGTRVGIIDTRGRWVVPPRYDNIDPYVSELARFQEGSQFGYLDRHGKVVWKPTK